MSRRNGPTGGTDQTIYVNRAAAPAWLLGWVERGWRVFNAPRPLPGCASQCWEFLHGTFYVAVDMTMPLADRVLEDISDLDGWSVELITNAEIQERVTRHLAENDVPLDDALETWGGWPGLAEAGGWPWCETKDGTKDGEK